MTDEDFIDTFNRILGKDYSTELIEVVLRQMNKSFNAGKTEGKKEVLKELWELSERHIYPHHISQWDLTNKSKEIK